MKNLQPTETKPTKTKQWILRHIYETYSAALCKNSVHLPHYPKTKKMNLEHTELHL